MNGGDSSVPIGAILDEILPELLSRESRRNNDSSTRAEGSQETTHETVDVEKRHDKVGSVGGVRL